MRVHYVAAPFQGRKLSGLVCKTAFAGVEFSRISSKSGLQIQKVAEILIGMGVSPDMLKHTTISIRYKAPSKINLRFSGLFSAAIVHGNAGVSEKTTNVVVPIHPDVHLIANQV